MGFKDWLREQVQDLVWDGRAVDPRVTEIAVRRNYRIGEQQKPLIVKADGADDNVIVNLVGLVVDRAVTMLFGKSIEFDLPGEGDTPQSQYIDAMWLANKKDILLHKMATDGAESGTVFVKLIPDGVVGMDGNPYVRLVLIDPKIIRVETKPDDIEYVTEYCIEYVYKTEEDGKKKEVRHVEETTRGREEVTDDAGNATYQATDTWRIVEKEKYQGSNAWVILRDEVWPYDFPPIIHWQNLPNARSCYGMPDITNDVIRLQNAINFGFSNMSKILRLHAHPTTIIKGADAKDIHVDPGKAIMIPAEADAFNLEMESDLASSFNYVNRLIDILFSTTQSVDVSSFSDKLGALTNFGLRVLYQDALSRLSSKQQLYGDAIIEINRRVSVIQGLGDDGGEIIWPEILPQDEAEVAKALQADLNMGIVDKQTVSEKRGYVWEDVQDRLSQEQVAGDNIGAAILRNFRNGV